MTIELSPADAYEILIVLARFLPRARSMRTITIPPRTNMNPEDNPSMMYCPITRPERNTTGYTAPVTRS